MGGAFLSILMQLILVTFVYQEVYGLYFNTKWDLKTQAILMSEEELYEEVKL